MSAEIIDSERGSGDSVHRNQELTVRVVDTFDEFDKLRPAWEEFTLKISFKIVEGANRRRKLARWPDYGSYTFKFLSSAWLIPT